MYESPFSTRYGSNLMKQLWSEVEKRRHWRRVWLAYARARDLEEVNVILANVMDVDIEASLELEERVKHDLVAELHVFASQCGIDVGLLHGKLTSSDVQDNAEVLRQQTAMGILLLRLERLFEVLSQVIQNTAFTQVMGRTHLQQARPTTIGHRLSVAGMGLLEAYLDMRLVSNTLMGKGLKGPVGTQVGIPFEVEKEAMEILGLRSRLVAGQTYDRVQDYRLLSGLAALAATLSKLALDVRLMKAFGELIGHKSNKQVGSSAMPEKTNPIREEKVCSLARIVIANSTTAWHNAANNMLERTLDDSANRRVIIPETFLALDEMLSSTTGYLHDMDYFVPMTDYGDVGDAPDMAIAVAETLADVMSEEGLS